MFITQIWVVSYQLLVVSPRITENLSVTGNATITGHVLLYANDTYDLGGFSECLERYIHRRLKFK